MATFQLYTDSAGEYRWRFMSDNGRIICTSSEGYSRKDTAVRSIEIVQEEASSASVEDQA